MFWRAYEKCTKGHIIGLSSVYQKNTELDKFVAFVSGTSLITAAKNKFQNGGVNRSNASTVVHVDMYCGNLDTSDEI